MSPDSRVFVACDEVRRDIFGKGLNLVQQFGRNFLITTNVYVDQTLCTILIN